jgi:hypothetical protein
MLIWILTLFPSLTAAVRLVLGYVDGLLLEDASRWVGLLPVTASAQPALTMPTVAPSTAVSRAWVAVGEDIVRI